jgi:hypothetical protein
MPTRLVDVIDLALLLELLLGLHTRTCLHEHTWSSLTVVLEQLVDEQLHADATTHSDSGEQKARVGAVRWDPR